MENQKDPQVEEEHELETKFDIQSFFETDALLRVCMEILQTNQWTISGQRQDEKDLLYYDSPELDFYRQGTTLRRVTPLDPAIKKGKIRYDFKQGSGESGIETNLWGNSPLTSREIITELGLENLVAKIIPIVMIHISPKFLDIYKDGTTAELKIDTCTHKGNVMFRELEIELKRGDPRNIYEISNALGKFEGFKPLELQKYSRVIEYLGLNKGGRK